MKARHRYRVYGLVIESELRLTSVEEVADGDGEPAVTLGFAPPDYFRTLAPGRATDPHDWVHHAVLDDGSVYMKADGAFETLISADGRTVTCGRLGEIDQRSFEANLLNFVMSASLTLQGEETLHSTALDIDGRAVGLLGLSGAGKSTLAAFLISRGADLVTDDMLRVKFDGALLLAYAGPYRLKLLDEPGTGFLPGAVADGFFNSLSGKVMVQPRAAVPRRRAPMPLAALFHLGHPDDQPAVGAVTAQARPRTDRLNAHLIASARTAGDVQALASPVTGGGIPVGRAQQLFLAELRTGKKRPDEWAGAAAKVLRAEPLASLVDQARAFAEGELPTLRALQVV